MKSRFLSEKKQIQKKIYAFIVTAMLFSVSTNAQIVYTDIVPDTTVSTNNGVYHLDLNNDGITDFNITYTTTGSSPHINLYIRITPLGANKVGNDTVYPSALPLNALIDSSSFTWKNNANQILLEKLWTMWGGFPPHWISHYVGNWNGVLNKDIPLQLDVSSQKYYGWVRLDVPTGAVSFTVKDYAYNSTPNQPIIVGQSNNAPLAILTSSAYCAADSIAIPISTYATFNPGNYFIAQLSDSVGSFNNPIILDSIQSTHADTIYTMIPAGMYPSVNYKIRILSTDTALQGSPTYHFTINEPPMATLANLGDTVCPGGTVLNLYNSGPCIGCSYQWQFNGSNIPNGTGSSTPIDSSGRYNVVVTNLCGVSISNIDTFFVMPVINITIPDSMNVCVANLPLQLNVASPAGGIYQGFGITSPNIFNGTFIGNYTIHYKISDSFGCQFTSPAMQIQVNTCTGVSEISNSNAIDIYPNPASDKLTISNEQGARGKVATISILDITGKIIYQTTNSTTEKTEVNTSNFAAGIYVVQIQSADFVATKKLVIKK